MTHQEPHAGNAPWTRLTLSIKQHAPALVAIAYRSKITTFAVATILLIMVGAILFLFRPTYVFVAKLERNAAIKVFGLGTVEARIFSRIGFKTSGTLVALYADHGDRVSAGQVIARIDNSEQRARLAKAEAQRLSTASAIEVSRAAVAKAEAQLAQRIIFNRRRQELLAKQSISTEAAEEAQLTENIARADVSVSRAELNAAEARFREAQAQFEYEKAILDQHELTAPFDGTIILRAKELGSILTATEPLFTIVAPDTVWILAYIDEVRSGDIRVGQSVELKLRSMPDTKFQGRVERIGIESDRVNEERRVYVSCLGCPETFHLGEQSEVLITTAVLDAALLVPETAIEIIGSSLGKVWAVENGRLFRKQLKLGKRSLDGRAEIAESVPEGVHIVAVVLPGFTEGQRVRIVQDK
jgi:HlyD family secretion protein